MPEIIDEQRLRGYWEAAEWTPKLSVSISPGERRAGRDLRSNESFDSLFLCDQEGEWHSVFRFQKASSSKQLSVFKVGFG